MKIGDLVKYNGFAHEQSCRRPIGIVMFIARPTGPENIELASVYWGPESGPSASSRLYKKGQLEVING